MADSDAKVLTASVAWALERALRLAVGTCVVALILATTLVGTAAERLATTAYLAAIFAAAVLAGQRLLRADLRDDGKRVWAPAFPSFLAFFASVTICLSVLGALVSRPGAEVTVFVGAVALVAAGVVVHAGGIGSAHAVLVRGGALAAVTRYTVVIGIGTLVLIAFLPGYTAEPVAQFAYRLMVVATFLTAVRLIAPTRAGTWMQQSWANTMVMVDKASRAFVFERTATYAAVVAVAAILCASSLPARNAEPFATIAYVAAAVAAFGVAMECRRLRA